MLWVGGHILIVGTDELGWHGPYDVVHDLEELGARRPARRGVLEWLVNTAASAVVGLAVGPGGRGRRVDDHGRAATSAEQPLT